MTRKTTKFLIRCSLFCALGVLFPMIFHLFGAVSGQTFLPMHIPVLIAGLVTSAPCGLIVGVLSPFLSCLLTEMPSFFKMPFMCIELGVYGLTSGLFMKLFGKRVKSETARIYLSLVCAQICGRLANLICTYFAIHVLGISNPAISVKLCLLSVPAGFIGIIIQLILIPPTARILLKIKSE